MEPAPLDLKIVRGDKFTCFFRVKQAGGTYINLTGYTAAAQIRQTDGDGAVAATFTAVIGDQTAFPGSVLLTLLKAVTTTLTPGTLVWDCEVIDGAGEPRTVLAGKVTVLKDVTHT